MPELPLNAERSYLYRLIAEARLCADDPAVGGAFSDADVIRSATRNARKVFSDLQAVSGSPVVLRATVTMPRGSRVAALPPNVGHVLKFGRKAGSDVLWQAALYSTWSTERFGWPGLRCQTTGAGGRIVAPAEASEDVQIVVDYLPSGDFSLHLGRVQLSEAPSGLTFPVVAATAESSNLLLGEVDLRPDAYAGASLRVWEATGSITAIREALVASYDPAQRELVLDSPLSPAVTAGTWLYELTPFYSDSLRQFVAIATAVTMCRTRGVPLRAESLMAEYRDALRTERLKATNASPEALRMPTDSIIDERFQGGW
jgi:hypothetical protein